jgi:hypothetical protein
MAKAREASASLAFVDLQSEKTGGIRCVNIPIYVIDEFSKLLKRFW